MKFIPPLSKAVLGELKAASDRTAQALEWAEQSENHHLIEVAQTAHLNARFCYLDTYEHIMQRALKEDEE